MKKDIVKNESYVFASHQESVISFLDYRSSVRKTIMFNAIHTATALLRETAGLKYLRIYSEPRKDGYRVKIYKSNINELSIKKYNRCRLILKNVFAKAGLNSTVSIINKDSYYNGNVTNLIIKINE
jgi:hypothetical protein